MKSWKTQLLMATTAGAVIMGVAATPAMAATNSVPQTTNKAIDFRATLDQLLGEHVVLAVDAMEKGYDGAPDYQAVANQLGQNTTDLSNAIASIYGQSAGDQFKKMWSAHIGDFVEYVTATKKGDKAGQQDALNKLSTYKDQFAKFLASADPKYLDANTLAQGLQTHVNQLIDTFNAYVKGNYQTSYDDWVQAYNHMYMTGDALSGAIVSQFPSKFDNKDPNTKAANLRISLDQLLGEHAFLAMVAMEKGYDANTGKAKTADYQAAATELSKDTDALTAAIQSLYGQAGATEFKTLWSGHITDFVNYVTATVKKDNAGKQQALNDLSQYRPKFGAFLHTADPHIDASAVAATLQTHVTQLIGTFNDYVAGNYTSAYSTFHDAFDHMNMPGLALSTGFVEQFPSKFADPMPSMMPRTGEGGASMSVQGYDSQMAVWLLATMAALAGSLVLLRKGLRKDH